MTNVPSAILSLLAAAAVAVEPAPAPPTPPTPPAPPAAPAPAASGATVDVIDLGFSSLRFGGVIGLSLGASLRYDAGWPVIPEVSGALGLSGTRMALGARWVVGERTWRLNAHGLHLDRTVQAAITPRVVAFYRWEDRDTRPAFFRGQTDEGGWYYGGELGLTFSGVALDVGVLWREEVDDRGPAVVLGYGFDF